MVQHDCVVRLLSFLKAGVRYRCPVSLATCCSRWFCFLFCAAPPTTHAHTHTVRDADKAAALLWLLREGLPKKSPTLVFASTRHHVEFLTLLLSLEGVEVTAVHGTMDQVGLVDVE